MVGVGSLGLPAGFFCFSLPVLWHKRLLRNPAVILHAPPPVAVTAAATAAART